MADILLDLRFIRYAVAASEYGSFRRAALHLGVPQSEISRRIRALEDRLGVAIFERGHRGSTPTPAGLEFLREAGRGAEQILRAVHGIGQVRRNERGRLRVGILPPLSSGFLRIAMAEFASHHRSVEIEVSAGTPSRLVSMVSDNTLDVAFVSGEPERVGCMTVPLWEEAVVVSLPQGHPLCDANVIAWQALRDERFIVTRGGSGTDVHDYLVKRFSSLGFRPDVVIHDVGREDLMHLVGLGFGLTLSRESSLVMPYQAVEHRPLSPKESFVSSAVWATRNANPALKKFVAWAKRRSQLPADFVGARGTRANRTG